MSGGSFLSSRITNYFCPGEMVNSTVMILLPWFVSNFAVCICIYNYICIYRYNMYNIYICVLYIPSLHIYTCNICTL